MLGKVRPDKEVRPSGDTIDHTEVGMKPVKMDHSLPRHPRMVAGDLMRQTAIYFTKRNSHGRA